MILVLKMGIVYHLEVVGCIEKVKFFEFMCYKQCWASYFVKVTSYTLYITCNQTI